MADSGLLKIIASHADIMAEISADQSTFGQPGLKIQHLSQLQFLARHNAASINVFSSYPP
jgi:hypothetical protein